MDPNWLDMVRERSQFVFLQLWRLDGLGVERPAVRLFGARHARDPR